MIVKAKTKKWGNSIGVVIPSDTVEKLHIQPEEEIIIEIQKKTNVLAELFGAFKFNNKSTEQLIKESKEDMKSKWLD